MIPTFATEHTALWTADGIRFPSQFQGTASVSVLPCVRLIRRLAPPVDLPECASALPCASSRALRPVPDLPSLPALLERPAAPCSLPFDYEYTDNRGRTHRAQGSHTFTEEEAELIGWLCSTGTLKEDHSVRFSSSDAAALGRVDRLATLLGCKVAWYAKDRGYDLTLTGGGVNSPIKHLLRRCLLVGRFPTGLTGLNLQKVVLPFLRGFWASQGWAYTKRGGNCVLLGLGRTDDLYLLHGMAALHQILRMPATIETRKKDGVSRLVFTGYNCFAAHSRYISASAFTIMTAPVVKQAPIYDTEVAKDGSSWYDAKVTGLRRLPPQPCYQLLWPKNTKPTPAPALRTPSTAALPG